jgi:hypothetical protein
VPESYISAEAFARMDPFPELRLEKTLEVLSATDNEAAAAVLLEGLARAQPRWQAKVLEALLARRSEPAGQELLSRWSQLGDHQRQLIARRPGWISNAIQSALAASEERLFASACNAARETGDTSQIPHLVALVIRGLSLPLLERVCQLTLHLVDRLRDELRERRDYQSRKGPQLHRAQALPILERALRQFDQHGRRELIEALLVIADRRNGAISHLLRNPADRAFGPLMDILSTSTRSSIMELLLDFLDDSMTPLSAMHAMMRRRDVTFVRLLCRKIGAAPTLTLRGNLKRVDQVAVLRQPAALLAMVDPSEQPGAVQLAVCSGVQRHQSLELVACALAEGSILGRRAAAEALAAFKGTDANAVALRALADDDPLVKASIARQLRQRDISDALPTLVSLLQSPQPAVRQAARESLADITFQRYLEMYDDWDEETRLREGRLLLRIDSHCVGQLVAELLSTSRSRQRRGLEITQLLGLAAQVEPTLAELAVDDDQYVRLEAVRLLAGVDTPLARELLRAAAHDKSALVQEAARQGLADTGVTPSVDTTTSWQALSKALPQPDEAS